MNSVCQFPGCGEPIHRLRFGGWIHVRSINVRRSAAAFAAGPVPADHNATPAVTS